MSDQHELVYRILQNLEKEGVLKHLLVVGSWCIFFYKQHFKEAELLPPIITRDIEFDISQLKKSHHKVDIAEILKKHGFVEDFQQSKGFVRFVHEYIIVEFLVPEKGKGRDDLYKVPGFGINAQAIRYLNFLEEEIIEIKYKDIMVKVPYPAMFAVHKLIISQKRPAKSAFKSENDIKQALAVWDMLVSMGAKEKIKKILSEIPKGWFKLVKQALSKVDEADRLNFV